MRHGFFLVICHETVLTAVQRSQVVSSFGMMTIQSAATALACIVPPFFKHDPVWHRIMQQTDKRCCQKARCAIEYARTMLLSCKQCLHTQGYVACCREGRGWAVWNFELRAWSCPTCFDTIINIYNCCFVEIRLAREKRT